MNKALQEIAAQLLGSFIFASIVIFFFYLIFREKKINKKEQAERIMKLEEEKQKILRRQRDDEYFAKLKANYDQKLRIKKHIELREIIDKMDNQSIITFMNNM